MKKVVVFMSNMWKKYISRITCFAVFMVSFYIAVTGYLQEDVLQVQPAFQCFVLLCGGLLAAYLFAGKYCLKRKYSSLFYPVLLTAGVSIVCFWMVEMVYNPGGFSEIENRFRFANIIVLALASVFLQLLIPFPKLPHYILLSASFVYSVANYYVWLFKGNPLRPCELRAWTTGLSVAGQYQYHITDGMVQAAVWLAIAVLVIRTVEYRKLSQMMPLPVKTGICVLLRCAGAAGIVGILAFVSWKDVWRASLDSWDVNNTYQRNGSVFAFLLETQEIKIKKPEGYAKEQVENLLKAYGDEEETGTDEVYPTIICIMNESFADLSVLGDIDTSEEMEGWNSVTDWLRKGYVYASIYGAGTCNSEFEFLTHNSMANLSCATFPYQFCDMRGVLNLSRELQEYGYHTVAFHPYFKKNWNRDIVYRDMGFQRFVSMDDMEEVQYFDRTGWVTDVCDYTTLQEIFETTERPAFVFNVTVQNHGGYATGKLGKDKLIDNTAFEQYNDVTAFRSLMKESGRAFADLISYFRTVEEPVILCFFGDHLPGLDGEFVNGFETSEAGTASDMIENRLRIYKTPYMIWSNYDTGQEPIWRDTSLNYLGAQVLELAGKSSSYTRYLRDLEQEIPIINAYGYQDKDGEWHEMSEANPKIGEYRNVEYYMMTK